MSQHEGPRPLPRNWRESYAERKKDAMRWLDGSRARRIDSCRHNTAATDAANGFASLEAEPFHDLESGPDGNMSSSLVHIGGRYRVEGGRTWLSYVLIFSISLLAACLKLEKKSCGKHIT